MKRVDLKGRRFRRWRVLRRTKKPNDRKTYWVCVCRCGRKRAVSSHLLLSGRSGSCGCLRAELNTSRRRTHGLSGSVEYRTWKAIKNRCTNPRSQDWKLYGGRGIKVCRRWLRSFSAFYRDMGKRPPGLSIDRRDTNGNYTPRNCRWATPLTQARNRRPACV